VSYSEYIKKTFFDDTNPKSISSWFRNRRRLLLVNIIKEVYETYGYVNILDVGGRMAYWKPFTYEFLRKYKVKVVFLNLESDKQEDLNGLFSFTEGNGCDLSMYSDNQFHLVHSNSVIEHVGRWDRMVAFAKETSRVGERLFIQTPSFWFPVEPHAHTPFIHWLPRPMRVSLVLCFKMGHWEKCRTVIEAANQIEAVMLLDYKMFDALYPTAKIVLEKFIFFPKSYIAIL